jgi:large subunit ribosomal protein L23
LEIWKFENSISKFSSRLRRDKFSNFGTMKSSDILIRPILTEKANAQQEKLRRYAFKVNKGANKLEIKKAVEEFYGITVVDVNTVIVPGKARSRSTKAGLIVGRKPGYKKALITVAEGESIDLYSNI